MHQHLPFAVHREKDQTAEQALVEAAVQVLRDPNRPIADRCVAWSCLRDRKGLPLTRRESIETYERLLANLVANSVGAKVEAGGETFYAERGKIQSRVGYGPRKPEHAR